MATKIDIGDMYAWRRRTELEHTLAEAVRKVGEAHRGQERAELALALLEEARLEWQLGRTDDAVMTVDRAISVARQAFGPKDERVASALELGADVAAAAGLQLNADARYRAALELLDELGVRGPLLADVLVHHARYREAQGDASGAQDAVSAAIELTRDSDDAPSRMLFATALTILGRLALAADRARDARLVADRALECWVELKTATRSEVGDALAIVAAAALAEHDFESAAEFARTANEVYERSAIDVRAERGRVQIVLAEAQTALGNAREAHSTFERALAFFREGAPERMQIEERMLELARGD